MTLARLDSSAVAPFSGTLVTADAVGSIGKSSSNNKNKQTNCFQKHSSSKKKKKKNNYLLKKRDGDPSSRSSSTLPDGYSQTVLRHTLSPPPHDTKTIEDDNERKLVPTSPTPPLAEAEMPVTAMPASEPPAVPVGGGKVTEEDKTKKKRPRVDDFDDNKELMKEKKKRKEKKIEELLAQGSVASSTFKEDSRPEPTRTPGPDVPAISGPKVDIGPLEFPMLLDHLKVLAMEPYYGVECHVPSVVGDVFLKFRSLVYEKSLALPLASETDDDQEIKPKEASHAAKEPKEQSKKTPKVKMGSLFNRPGDPARAGKKREREEISVKRLSKMAATAPPVCLEDKKAVSTPTNPSSSADLARKRMRQELVPLPVPPKNPSPTNLILKFPPRSALPSIPNLKARFARFGQLIVDRCRVIWDTHSCRVQYKYKADALAAYNYAKDNNLFGQIPVKYIVREVELPSSMSEPERPGSGSGSQPESSAQFMPGNGNGNSMTQSRPKYKPAPLKSILKKPGEDVVKENQRVKFKLAGDESKPVMPSVSVGGGLPKFPSPPPPVVPLPKPTAIVPTSLPRNSLQAPKHHTILLSTTAADAVARPVPTRPPPPPPASLAYRPSLTPLHLQVQQRSPPSPVTRQEMQQRQQQQYGGGGGGGSVEGSSKSGNRPEVSEKVLSILHRCNDIINVLHSLPGFSPYRPL